MSVPPSVNTAVQVYVPALSCTTFCICNCDTVSETIFVSLLFGTEPKLNPQMKDVAGELVVHMKTASSPSLRVISSGVITMLRTPGMGVGVGTLWIDVDGSRSVVRLP